jgi:lipopolysaccharide export system protein LptC
MVSTRNLLLSSLLMLAFVLTAWSLFIIYDKKTIPMIMTGKPDAFMEDVVATIIDKQGHPALKIAASKMVHYPENDSTDIANPWLTFYRQSPQPWQLTAEHAKTLQGIEQIILWENVVIHHPGDDQNQNTTLHAPTLTVFPNQQFAITQDPVVITQPNTVIHAIGMSADLASGAVKLLSEAKGEFSVQN